MERQLKVSRAVIAGAVATIVAFSATELRAQADTTVKALEQQQMSTVDKKKQKQPRGQSRGIPQSNVIGARPRSGTEVPAKCEDARALAAQIVSGGPTDRMVYNPRLGSLDASRGLEAPPFEARMQPRDQRQINGMSSGTYRRGAGDSEMSRSMRAMQSPNNPATTLPHC